MFRTFAEDLRAVRRNDPAAISTIETLFFHSPLHAIFLYRVGHRLRERFGLTFLPRLLSALARFLTGVEIHPGAQIGRRLFIDHGTGVVIGETACVGDDCVMFHNVTLGGTGKHAGKRHPTLKDDVFVGTGAILLGPITVGQAARIGANSFIHMRDVPPHCTVVGVPGRIVKRDGRVVDEELPRARLTEDSIPVVSP